MIERKSAEPLQGGHIVKDHRKSLLILYPHGWIREEDLRPVYDIVECRWDGDRKIREIRFDLSHLLLLEERAFAFLQKLCVRARESHIRISVQNVAPDLQRDFLSRGLEESCNVELDPALERDFRDSKAKENKPLTNRWILIIDDSAFFRKQLAARLQSEGYTVREAETSSDGYAILKALPIHLVILDCLLPDLDGIMTAELIRADKTLQRMPIIFATGQETDEPRKQAARLGQGYYVKSQPVDDLLKLVKDLLAPTETSAGNDVLPPSPAGGTKEGGPEVVSPAAHRILIVDDSGFVRRQTALILDAAGFHTLSASTGIEGLGIASTESVDLILLDLNLPDFDGLDTLRALKSREETREIPVVIFSVRREREMIVRALDGGAANYLLKPFETAELLERVRSCLRPAESRPPVARRATGSNVREPRSPAANR